MPPGLLPLHREWEKGAIHGHGESGRNVCFHAVYCTVRGAELLLDTEFEVYLLLSTFPIQ